MANKIEVSLIIKKVKRIFSESNIYTGFKKGEKIIGALKGSNGTMLCNDVKAEVVIKLEDMETKGTINLDLWKKIKETTGWKRLSPERFEALKKGLEDEIIETFMIEDVDYDMRDIIDKIMDKVSLIAYNYDKDKKRKKNKKK